MISELKYEILDCKFNSSADRWVERYTSEFRGVDNYEEVLAFNFDRQEDLKCSLGLLFLHHLEYQTGISPKEYLEKGFEVAVNYFCEDWWNEDEADRRAMDQSREDWRPRWSDQFRNSLLLGLLIERWDELGQICNWVEASLEPGYIGDTHADYIFVKVHLSVAASLREKPMPGIDEMEQDILDSKQRGPIQLFEAWTAARNNDQAGFEKGLIASLKRTGSRRGRKPFVFDWIGINESIVALAAQRLGMTIPDLPPKLNALLITPESIGVK